MEAWEKSLRPKTLADFIGQGELKKRISLLIEASKARGDSPDHILFYGPPGLGKTTLASIIANELSSPFFQLSGPSISRAGDLAAILSGLEKGSVLFIDEVHRIPRSCEEMLYSAMEDYRIDIVVGKGVMAKTISIDLPPFTLIGATTRLGLLTGALRSRFGVIERIDFYPVEELEQIVFRSAMILGVEISKEAAKEVAIRGRGTPRIVNRLLKRIRDYAQVEGREFIDRELTLRALDFYGVDPYGLDLTDWRLISIIIEKFSGGPVGIETLAAALNEEPDTISEVYEPYLMRMGFIERTKRGRVATQRAYEIWKRRGCNGIFG
ncbi:MAG: Holliday junction branch migration DNA helicase RuvB [Synergistetes bacterium]|nr:Holliday junction branch migration DNA helicase RuvB [Synergistota bacterium]MCX8127204.1 Holliday junction branch migration DNA helicase RuvB [Synergistota bacterium]MDW8191910.1 Holliday junction branch migration DNA helicase RuvB [Synergistota bacterium]